MTSPRKQEANRRNASKSTGPRTAAGKRASARNAVRHGLSIGSLADPAWASEIRELARQMVAEDASPVLTQLAFTIAAAQIDLARVRRARHEFVSSTLADEFFEPRIQILKREMIIANRQELPIGSYERLMRGLMQRPTGDMRLLLVYFELADELDRLERYERRALSRRRKAMRAFDLAARSWPGSLLGPARASQKD